MLLDEQLRVIVANEAAARLFRSSITDLTGVALAALMPRHNLARWMNEFGPERRKVLEMTVDLAGDGDPRVTVKMIAVPLAGPSTRVRARRGRGIVPEYRLLVLEDITDRAALEQQLVESEKQAAMGQLAAGILHEVANPLTALGSNLLFVRGTLGDRPALQQTLDMSLDQLDQMRQLLGTLSGFPTRTTPAVAPANLVDVVRRSVEFIQKDALRRRVRIAVHDSATRIICPMDVRLIRQVLLNVFKNAIEAMPDGGLIDVRLRHRCESGDATNMAVIEVADTGAGITAPDLRKVFRPLFSTKPRGAGLGLSFCRQAVEEHGGHIRIVSPGLDRGAIVSIALPLDHASSRED